MNFPKEIDKRLKNGIGCWSGIGKGWHKLVIKLDKKIAKLYPDYTIDQVKEKFGGLRYYIGSVPEGVFDEIHELISEAEAQSLKTCDTCGKTGKGVAIKGWWVTRCTKHSKA